MLGGRRFTNFEGEAPGALAMHTAFAISCNTAFVGLSASLPSGALQSAARSFGFGMSPHLGLASLGGNVPTPEDTADEAAESIGQGRITVSPLEMAVVAATVDAGIWQPPALVVDPVLDNGPPPAVAPEAPAVIAGLRSMMAEVVAAGTGSAARVPGQAVFGKTGTAEFGTGTPPSTHAWFIGFKGTLAFAILVEGGGVGGQVAAPLAARFLAGLPPA
jgi:cell division protein FtsI/penicillin-binding protein 2